MAHEHRDRLPDQDVPVVKVIGRVRGEKTEANIGDEPSISMRFVIYVSWTRRVYSVSQHMLEVMQMLDMTVIDNPDDYAF